MWAISPGWRGPWVTPLRGPAGPRFVARTAGPRLVAAAIVEALESRPDLREVELGARAQQLQADMTG